MDDTEVFAPDSMPEGQAPRESAQVLTPQDVSPRESPQAAERPRTVPYGALAEERARRKELQRELQESAATRQLLQERLDALHALAGQMEPSTPEGSFGIEETITPDGEGAAANSMPAEAADNAFSTQVLQSVRSYAAERPDFMDAYQHARQARVAELAALGYGPEEALAITFDNEREVINSAFAAGRNPAEIIYDYALRQGYHPAGRGQTSAAGIGQVPTSRSVGGGAPMTEAEKVALAARGQAAAKSLSAAGGGSTGTLTLEALAGMSDEEFAEATKGDRWQRLLRA